MSEPKTRPTGASVTAFLEEIADERRREDCRTIAAWMQTASQAPAEMWGDSIVGFGRYRQRYANGSELDWPAIGFAPRKQDLVLYLADFDGSEALLARLGKHRTSKACLYIKRLSDVDASVLRELIDGTASVMADRRTDR